MRLHQSTRERERSESECPLRSRTPHAGPRRLSVQLQGLGFLRVCALSLWRQSELGGGGEALVFRALSCLRAPGGCTGGEYLRSRFFLISLERVPAHWTVRLRGARRGGGVDVEAQCQSGVSGL